MVTAVSDGWENRVNPHSATIFFSCVIATMKKPVWKREPGNPAVNRFCGGCGSALTEEAKNTQESIIAMDERLAGQDEALIRETFLKMMDAGEI